MPTYTTPQLRNNLRVALDQAKSGQTVLITRHDETFRLMLDGGNSSKANVGVKPETTSEIPAPEPVIKITTNDGVYYPENGTGYIAEPGQIFIYSIKNGEYTFRPNTTTDKPVINKGASR